MLMSAPEVEHEIFLAKLFNDTLAGPANAALRMVGLKEDARPWDNALPMEILVVLLIVILFTVLRSRLSVDKPGPVQHMVEVVYQFLQQTADEIGIHHSEKYVPMFGTLFFLILFANLIGLIPGLESPTMGYAMPLGLAVVVFVYYNYLGFKVQGVGKYLMHFVGPLLVLAPLMIPIEIISHLARPMSLTIRLRANMYAGEQVTDAFMDLTKLIVPVIFMFLHVFVSFLQAYIFVLLAMIYVSGSVEEHQEEH
ncbi:MAG TPA: F0F1 ATP synthase subunit A [Bryobacteraceae bacterium]